MWVLHRTAQTGASRWENDLSINKSVAVNRFFRYSFQANLIFCKCVCVFIALLHIFPPLNASVCTSLVTNLCTSHICDFNLQPFSKSTQNGIKKKDKQINAHPHTHSDFLCGSRRIKSIAKQELVEHDVHWVHIRVYTNCFVVLTTMKLQFLCVCYDIIWYGMMWCDVMWYES